MATHSTDDQALAAALAAARSEPEKNDHWALAEQLAEILQRVDEVAAAYREALAHDLSPDAIERLGRRAAAFHEAWLGDDNASLARVLLRVLAVQPGAEWAFAQLTAVYTLRERWTDLLAVYDQTLVAPVGEARRVQLLEEAANIARDFAGQADRAVGYMQQLLGLRPGDERLEASLERLLERQGRWGDLVALWKRRIELLGREATAGLQARIAEASLDRLHDPALALEEVRTLLQESAGDREGTALLERLIVLKSADASVRAGALDLLRSSFEDARRPEEVIRVLGVALPLADPAAAIALHREIGERLVAIDRAVSAMEHYVALLGLAPDAHDDQRRLRHLAETTGEFLLYVLGLLGAADATRDRERRVALLAEAGDVQHATLHDTAAAIELYTRVLAESAAPAATALRVARILDRLLEETGRSAERLVVLERLGALEDDAARSQVLGDAARLAENLGEPERALHSWRARLGHDGDDSEALSHAIRLLEQLSRWAELVGVLRQRANGPVAPHQRRADLARVAILEAQQLDDAASAITTWLAIQREFGENGETVEALAALLSRVTRWKDLADLLGRAAGRETAALADLSTRLGDVYRGQLGQSTRAVACYDAALSADPTHAGARAGLLAVLEDAVARPAAVELLGKLYRKREEWPDLAGIVEARLAGTDDPRKQADILRETAALQEQHVHDANAALALLRRAFARIPRDRELERDLVRLADQTGDWRTAVEAYREAVSSLVGEPRRSAELRLSEARIHEHKLGEPEPALLAYQAVLAIEPGDPDAARGAVRMAARVNRWDAAAAALVGQVAADEKLDTSLLALLESQAGEHDGWQGITLSLETALGRARLPAAPAALLTARVALWHRDHRGDAAAAMAALQRSLAIEPGKLERLIQLAELQRATPDAALIDTLLALDAQREDNFDELYEASELALGLDGDTPRSREILNRLKDRAAALWNRGLAARGRRSPEESVAWGVQQLGRLHDQAGERRQAADLLARSATLPFAAETSQAMRLRAAAIYGELGARTLAIALYRGVLDERPDDLATLRLLGALLEAEERYPELLTLRHHELARTSEPTRKLELRLDIARLVGIVEQRGGRIEVLRRNLEEQPGHDPSLAALTEVLSAKASPDELAGFLGQHAERLEAVGDKPRAVRLWAQLATLAEQRLGDVERALEAHRRVVVLEPRLDALDALARLRMARSEPAEAVQWLTQRLDKTTGPERTPVVLQLAEALLGASRSERATQVLARAVADEPGESRTRDLLLKLYRDAQAWEPLAALLQVAAAHTDQRAQILAHLYEAAAIYRDRLGTLDRAIPVLEQLRRLVPDDRGVLQSLADALWAANRHADARVILEQLLAEFGRRRSSERAAVHTKLAALARGEGNRIEALAQLELATNMDMANIPALQMLAELSQESGDSARAERSYRALLLAARRRTVDANSDVLGISEALYELSRLAAARKQDGQAAELLESAIHTALQDDREAGKLQRTLRLRGDAPLLIRVLRSRLSHGPEGEVKAAILGELADALDTTGRAEEALGLRLQALQDAPGSVNLHRAAAEQAARLGQSQRYVDSLTALVERARRKADSAVAADLLIRSAEIVEREFGDLERAAEMYGRVEAQGHRVVEAWMGLARIAAARGDSARQVELFERISSAPDDAMTPEVRARAAFGLAEIHLAAPESRDAGVAAMRRALEHDPRYSVAEPILRRTLAAAPDHAELLALYEHVVREIGDKAQLLAFLERRAAAEDANPAVAREAAELAVETGADDERVASLLGRTLELSRERGDGNEHAIWALLALARRHQAAGDLVGAIAYLRDASGLAEPSQVFSLGLELAGLAAAQPDKLSLAAELYEDLLAQDPSNREVWLPLMDVYKRLEDQSRLQQLVEATLQTLGDAKERNTLRLELVHSLLANIGRETDAVRLLKDILMEEPSHKEAERLLASVFERTGYDSELVELLGQQLLTAQEAKDVDGVVASALRLGELHRRTQPDEAKSVYRAALEVAPENRELIEALLSQLDPEHDNRERAEITERLLAVETGDAAVQRTLDLASQWVKLGEPESVARVLERGYKAAPESDELRARLDSWYREREDWASLAALLVDSADRAIEPTDAVRLLREASELYADKLSDAARAAEVLRKACGYDPIDMVLLRELVNRLADTGEHQAAIDELTQAIDWQPLDQATLVEFLRRRAELGMIVGNEAQAAQDLERAYEVVGPELIPDLVDGLERWRSAATRRSDRAGERAATLRLVEILGKEGAGEQARVALAEWVAREPGDTQALRMLMDMDRAAGRWEDVVASVTKLVAAETGPAQIEAVLQLVEATGKVGRPEDARAGLEVAHQAQPQNEAVRGRLKQIYEEEENYPALARILIGEASGIEDEGARFLMLRQAGELLLDEDAASAAEALKQALALKPSDQAVNLLLVEAYTAAKQQDNADAILDAAIDAMKGRRSPELCVLQYRKAAVAASAGNQEQQLHWLKEAHNTDRNNGDVAVELAALAEKLEDYDLAIRVLRSIALMEAAPMSRAVAYLRQGYIAERRGDRQKAVLWGRKALMEDPNCTEATDFLKQIGEL
ncbi:MAG: tetratricopeptide repeat protein [Nannocystis sp.]|uniref:tetratricopeptide repeat protein n=1 Tax=Nannocystis sp. TaxID=1962667 RepID=UPI002428F4AE|nr:tetratricopeptide repeat protein [Nannocystis sp.]MBK9754663.1 tetratricopeptide repeat protein [Nannocystis sp.]